MYGVSITDDKNTVYAKKDPGKQHKVAPMKEENKKGFNKVGRMADEDEAEAHNEGELTMAHKGMKRRRINLAGRMVDVIYMWQEKLLCSRLLA